MAPVETSLAHENNLLKGVVCFPFEQGIHTQLYEVFRGDIFSKGYIHVKLFEYVGAFLKGDIIVFTPYSR